MNISFKTPFILTFLSVFIFYSCKKNNRSTSQNVSARIDSTGVCGFLVKINSSTYAAVNLPDLYQKDSLKILISYHLLNSTRACFYANPNPEIYIDAIHVQR